jgi:hypothetical protein
MAKRATATAATATATPIHRLEELELEGGAAGEVPAFLLLALEAQQGFLAGTSGFEELSAPLLDVLLVSSDALFSLVQQGFFGGSTSTSGFGSTTLLLSQHEVPSVLGGVMLWLLSTSLTEGTSSGSAALIEAESTVPACTVGRVSSEDITLTEEEVQDAGATSIGTSTKMTVCVGSDAGSGGLTDSLSNSVFLSVASSSVATSRVRSPSGTGVSGRERGAGAGEVGASADAAAEVSGLLGLRPGVREDLVGVGFGIESAF